MTHMYACLCPSCDCRACSYVSMHACMCVDVSVLQSQPEWIVYHELLETSHTFMKGITIVRHPTAIVNHKASSMGSRFVGHDWCLGKHFEFV